MENLTKQDKELLEVLSSFPKEQVILALLDALEWIQGEWAITPEEFLAQRLDIKDDKTS